MAKVELRVIDLSADVLGSTLGKSPKSSVFNAAVFGEMMLSRSAGNEISWSAAISKNAPIGTYAQVQISLCSQWYTSLSKKQMTMAPDNTNYS